MMRKKRETKHKKRKLIALVRLPNDTYIRVGLFASTHDEAYKKLRRWYGIESRFQVMPYRKELEALLDDAEW